MNIHCHFAAQTDVGLISRTFSLKITKFSTFSEINQGWQCLKIVFIWSDKLTYRISTSHYVLNLRYRCHYSKYKDLYYKTTKSLNRDNIKILLINVR